MQFTGLAVGVGALALLVLWLGVRILWRGHWFLAWLRGSLGLTVILLALLAGGLAYDIHSYQQQQQGKRIAVLKVGSGDNDRYRVTLDDGRNSWQFLLDGELWGMDVQLLDWHGLASLIGLQPGYRLSGINARFLGIEQQNAAQYPEQPLARSWWGLDVWQGMQLAGGSLPFVEAKLVRLSFIPLADNAEYGIEWLPTGLQAKPLNEQARQALRNWVE
ncbi:hypothetical protein [Thiopseudomonas denitrificans]|mgnify:CR=1 FL=1|uniref:Multidrug transporter n=1 Tax=Thiopseudomonas denitrificans TaxID=1501432 RepID=A0A4R6U951_9GAMM|nr:hypothetical protein [Thiopseudomonas denitrificans]TDQ39594.1 hypothetical protein DFQ45_102295 [Thiopseudomonas denitrificans]